MDSFTRTHILTGKSLLKVLNETLRPTRKFGVRSGSRRKTTCSPGGSLGIPEHARASGGCSIPIGTSTSPSPTRVRSRPYGRLAKSTTMSCGGLWDQLLATIHHNQSDWLERRSGRASNGRYQGLDMNIVYDAEHVFASQHPPASATVDELATVRGSTRFDSVITN